MGIEILSGLVALLVGAIVPGLKEIVEIYLKQSTKSGSGKFQNALAKIFKVEIAISTSYKERLSNTLDILKKTLSEVDKATIEFSALMKERENNIDLLEKRLSELTTEETNLKNKVETLQKVPIEALSHFEEILNKGDKRSATRDYKLFGLGVIVSIVVTIILKLALNI